MSTMTNKYSMKDSDPIGTINHIKSAIDNGWSVVKISIDKNDGFDTYKVDFEKVEMG